MLQSMKKIYLFILCLSAVIAGCYKDKGNYDYVDVPAPVMSGLDSVYHVMSGDSLIVAPHITLKSGPNDYSCEWKINIPERATTDDYFTRDLRIVYGLGAARYNVLLKVTDNNTGQKYFYDFVISGQTAFTRGMLVVSGDAGSTSLSFIKPDGGLQADIYEAINKVVLPGGPRQIVQVRNQFYMNQITQYWLTFGGNEGAVLIDANTLGQVRTLKENFYQPMAATQANYFLRNLNGTTTAIINDQLFMGTFETAPFGSYYGYFGVAVNGEYKLAPQLLQELAESGQSVSHFLGFDKEKKRFVRFLPGTYLDTTYTVMDSAFVPKKLGMDLIYMEKFSDNDIFAFCDSLGKTMQLRFGLNWKDGRQQFFAREMKKFKGDSLVTATTKWAVSPVGVFYFTGNGKIYRYNPLNEEIRELTTSFSSKEITLLKVEQNGNMLAVGVEGELHLLNTAVGQFGELIRKTTGIPGSPTDILIRD